MCLNECLNGSKSCASAHWLQSSIDTSGGPGGDSSNPLLLSETFLYMDIKKDAPAIAFKLPCGGECVGLWSIHQHRHHPGTSDFLPFTGQSRHHSYGPSYMSLKCERSRSRRDVPRRLMPTTTELQSANVVARGSTTLCDLAFLRLGLGKPFGPSGRRKTRSKLVNALHCRSHSASSWASQDSGQPPNLGYFWNQGS